MERIPAAGRAGSGASTLNGNAASSIGIINNELYVGRLVWNRVRYVKDPRTGKRISRLNPLDLWIITELPELRLLDDSIWTAAKQRQIELALPERSQKIRNALNTRHRARYLLSGLLVCGVCGAGYTLIGSDRYGCADHVNRGTCSNGRTIKRQEIERRVLGGLKEKLLAPDLIATFVKEFQEEWNRRASTANRRRATLEAELADIERRIDQVMAAIEQGVVTATTKARLLELEAKRDLRRAELAKQSEAALVPVLHPKLPEVYRRKVADLEIALNDPAIQTEAATILRGLIDAVVLHPGAGRGEVQAELHGKLIALLRLGEGRKAKTRTSPDMRVSLVAGACNHRQHTVCVEV